MRCSTNWTSSVHDKERYGYSCIPRQNVKFTHKLFEAVPSMSILKASERLDIPISNVYTTVAGKS